MSMRIILVFGDQTDIPNSVLCPIQVPRELPPTVVPTKVPQAGVRINVVQEEPLDLQCLAKISVMCVVEDVSI